MNDNIFPVAFHATSPASTATCEPSPTAGDPFPMPDVPPVVPGKAWQPVTVSPGLPDYRHEPVEPANDPAEAITPASDPPSPRTPPLTRKRPSIPGERTPPPSARMRAITARLRSHPRKSVADFIRMGRLLAEAKNLLKRGSVTRDEHSSLQSRILEPGNLTKAAGRRCLEHSHPISAATFFTSSTFIFE